MAFSSPSLKFHFSQANQDIVKSPNITKGIMKSVDTEQTVSPKLRDACNNVTRSIDTAKKSKTSMTTNKMVSSKNCRFVSEQTAEEQHESIPDTKMSYSTSIAALGAAPHTQVDDVPDIPKKLYDDSCIQNIGSDPTLQESLPPQSPHFCISKTEATPSLGDSRDFQLNDESAENIFNADVIKMHFNSAVAALKDCLRRALHLEVESQRQLQNIEEQINIQNSRKRIFREAAKQWLSCDSPEQEQWELLDQNAEKAP